MQDLRKNRRRVNNEQMSITNNISEPEVTLELDDLERGCKCDDNRVGQTNKCHDKHDKCHDKCECKNKEEFECECHCKPVKCTDNECESCNVVSDVCVPNTCREECCNGISPTFSTRDARPVAIEANRIFDSIQFRVFTDATGPNGEPLFFDFEVIEVRGNIPNRGTARVTVDEVCMNFSSIEIMPGDVTVDDFDVTPIENNSSCDTVFESIVCPIRNARCCAQNRGQNVLFRERGLTVRIEDLVLEVRGHCGRTRIVALAFPAIKRMKKLCRVDSVEFKFNTLASNICTPSSGRSFTLRQDFKTNLSVDCISNAFISIEDNFDCDDDHNHNHGCDCDCNCDCDCDRDCDDFDDIEFTVPSGIDVILCVEETVSALIGDQLVVLADTNFAPRVVDTFANVCRFPGCGE